VNVHRHSGASIVHIALKRSLQVVIMEVHDDGRGIALALLDRLRRANTDAGVGLAGMRNCAPQEVHTHITRCHFRE
jgi:signal transduction histidine kinase